MDIRILDMLVRRRSRGKRLLYLGSTRLHIGNLTYNGKMNRGVREVIRGNRWVGKLSKMKYSFLKGNMTIDDNMRGFQIIASVPSMPRWIAKK